MSNKNEKEALNGQEQTNVMKAIYEAIWKYEDLGSMDVNFEDLSADGEPNIGLFTMPGAVYLKKFITGGFKAMLPFSVVYRANLNTDNHKFELIDWLNNFGEWISSHKNFPALSDGRIVEKIEQTSVPYRNTLDKGCENDYIATFQMTYRKDE